MAKLKGNWVVMLKRTVTTQLYCEDCTEDEARDDPWEHATGDDVELDCIDEDVIDVKAD